MDAIKAEYDATIRSWERGARWHRRWLARIGLQGKLLICFLALLIGALSGSCWLFIRQSSRQINDLMKEQARQTAFSLALASKSAMADGEVRELHQIGLDLLKGRNILSVAFLNAQAHPLTMASRDPDFNFSSLDALKHNPQMLMQARWTNSPVFGRHLQVTAPVLSTWSPPQEDAAGAAGSLERGDVNHGGQVRLIGYVSVGISTTREQAQLRQVEYWVTAIGCMFVLASLPVAYAMVRRVFYPIRQLVSATNAITRGDLETQVAIHRPDVIGTLARSFNDMVRRVRDQQRALEEANRDLEQKVHQRTGQLEAANGRLSREIAEKEDFLRAVSHDLNAPLRNIDGMASMLLTRHRDKLDPDVVHRLERIQKNVEVETDLISELLELSRIKSRQQKLEMVEIEAMVRQLGEMFEEDLTRRGIALSLDTPLPVLHAEGARLRQVFQNLIDNAIKYMGDGPTREIHVGCQVRAGEAEFYVRDTGLGIEPEEAPKVFYIFRRGRNSAGANATGKGVGLASVKSIVETYNGSIWVESRPGEGSTFRFTINGRFVPSSAGSSARAINEETVRQTGLTEELV
jgi:signal transduction histidine kinase